GSDIVGGLGLGHTMQLSATQEPTGYGSVPLVAGYTADSIVAGAGHTCVRLNGTMPGQLECWGLNNVGQLGLGQPRAAVGDDDNPAAAGLVVTDPLGVSSIVAGGSHTCATFARDGGLRCWGANLYGQLGLPNLDSQGSTYDSAPAVLPSVSFGPGATVEMVAAG